MRWFTEIAWIYLIPCQLMVLLSLLNLEQYMPLDLAQFITIALPVLIMLGSAIWFRRRRK